MKNESAVTRYNPLMIGLHWLTALLLIAVYCAMEFRGYFPKGSDARDLMKALHFMLGLTVLLVVVVRLAVRVSSPKPAIVPAPKAAEALMASLMHGLLYLFMLAMPIAGWVILSAEGHGVPFFGLELPPLLGKNHDLAEQIEDLHKLGGTLGYYLIALHALAGLAHHYIKKDNTLLRILPFKSQG
jgi:superoxide oxidase